ncbi:MAG: chromosomal replication initiator protein DnaA [Deltaproteobacteria bacterium]|nr:chromosomal replication initiator protein DnaA [Deltaproteobacteria bacterium]MBW2253059.1 chromosomal replication initiator protein DnaA [Deltaproteobacteria bacterium]
MDPEQLWENMLEAMQKRIGPQDVEIWLRSAQPIRLDGKRLLLEVANRYYSDWIGENYRGALQEVADELLGPRAELEFIARDDPATGEAPMPTTDASTGASDSQPRAIGVNPTQDFEAFVVGECNKFAHAAARAVADYPASNYNPLFIYGSTGLGKTHLMHAIGNEILGRVSAARVVYVTAEDFMNEMINCLRYKRMEDFRSKYRKRATVLLVDDIQFLSGKDRTQEEFFHTFNALQNSNRQVVLTADVIPKSIEKLEPRLRTRFEGGLLADLQAPDKETLLAILYQKADVLNIHIPADLADAIANTVAGNIRELEGVLNRLVALQNFYHEALSLEFARKQMPNIFTPAPAQVTVSGIIEAVARFHNLRSADITGNKRTRTLTRPRHIAMYLARTHTNLSFPELGREFGGRDHSTIQHGYRKVERELRDNADLAYKIRLIEQGLQVRSSR